MADKVAKGRAPNKGYPAKRRTEAYREREAKRDEVAREILRLRAQGLSYNQIAARCGVHWTGVGLIVRGLRRRRAQEAEAA